MRVTIDVKSDDRKELAAAMMVAAARILTQPDHFTGCGMELPSTKTYMHFRIEQDDIYKNPPKIT